MELQKAFTVQKVLIVGELRVQRYCFPFLYHCHVAQHVALQLHVAAGT